LFVRFRLSNANICRSCRRAQSDIHPLVPRKALRWQGQASAGSVLGSNISALVTASSAPPVSTAVGGHEVLDAPAPPLPNPTPSTGAALLEAEVEKSIQIGMVMLEWLPRFGLDPALEVVLP
jgi:hypothetical protein